MNVRNTIIKELNNYNPGSVDSIINSLIEYNQCFKELFDTYIRHYTVREHSKLTIKEYDKYFSVNHSKQTQFWFRLLLIFHDVGKNKSLIGQHVKSKEVIIKHRDIFPLSDWKFNLLLAIIKHDLIGEYFQNKRELSYVVATIANKSKQCNLKYSCFIKLNIMYYQCDISSYTVDAGGSFYLENLFEYNLKDNCKKYDKENECLVMNASLTNKYINLINSNIL
jgi:hypothetical protein